MDAAYVNKTRMFPTYTTQELEAALLPTSPSAKHMTAEHRAKIEAEIANRKSGASKHFAVPQI